MIIDLLCIPLQGKLSDHLVCNETHVYVSSPHFPLFFFFPSPQLLTLSTVNSAYVYCSRSYKLHFLATFFIKNGSHNTIYTFKNYFATVFSVSVFSFSKNKLNPKTPGERVFLHFAEKWWVSQYCSRTHKSYLNTDFNINLGFMALFTHLKIILL